MGDVFDKVFVGALALIAAAVLRVRCKSNYGFYLFIAMFILNATASRFGILREPAKAWYVRWPVLMMLAALAFTPTGSTATTRRHQGFRAGIAVFLVIAVISSVYAPSEQYVFMRAVSFGILCVGTYWGVFKRAGGRDRLKEYVDVLYKLAFVVVGLGMVMLVRPMGEGETRFSGFFYNANGSGIFCAMLLPVVIWTYWERRRLGSRGALTALGLAIVMAAFIFLSGSRGAIITTFFASAFLLVTLYRSQAVILVGVILAVAVVGVIASGYFSTDTLEGTRFDRSTGVLGSTHRMDLWREAWPYIEEHPIRGTGFGFSRYIFEAKIRTDGLDPLAFHGRTLHSMHIQVLVDLGIVGLVFLEVFIIYLLVQGWKIFFRRDRTPERALAAALFASCLVVCMDSFIHGWLYSAGSQCALLFHVIAACTLQATSQWEAARRAGAATEEDGSEEREEEREALAVGANQTGGS